MPTVQLTIDLSENLMRWLIEEAERHEVGLDILVENILETCWLEGSPGERLQDHLEGE